MSTGIAELADKIKAQDRERHRLLKAFAEDALLFLYGKDHNTGIMLSPERAEHYNRLHTALFDLVKAGAIDNVVGK